MVKKIGAAKAGNINTSNDFIIKLIFRDNFFQWSKTEKIILLHYWTIM